MEDYSDMEFPGTIDASSLGGRLCYLLGGLGTDESVKAEIAKDVFNARILDCFGREDARRYLQGGTPLDLAPPAMIQHEERWAGFPSI